MTAHSFDRKLDSLVLDLLEWVAKEPRTYRQTMEAWRTSCPRLAVWEEAVDRDFVVRGVDSAGQMSVKPTAAGLRFLQSAGRVRGHPQTREAPGSCEPGASTEGTVPGFRPYR